MTEPIDDPKYWEQRYASLRGRPTHHAIYNCGNAEDWKRIEEVHRRLIAKYVDEEDSILDVGCGWGRLIDMLPIGWSGRYVGVDLSPLFLSKARTAHPGYDFRELTFDRIDSSTVLQGDLSQFDWAVCISIKGMLLNNKGTEAWDELLSRLHTVADRVLVLEYSETDKGEIL